MKHILDLVRPMADARFAVCYSLADGADGGRYYDVHKLSNMHHALTLLAYDMNGAGRSRLVRLRSKNEPDRAVFRSASQSGAC